MRKLIHMFMAGCFALLLIGTETALGQIIIAQDDASNYGGNWGTGTNGGFGFGEWDISHKGSGNSGYFIGTSNHNGRQIIDSNEKSFALYSNGGTGTGVLARRYFGHNPENELKPNESFSFDLSFSWSNGRRGIDFWSGIDGSGFLFNIEHSWNDKLTIFPVNGERVDLVDNIYNKAIRITVTNNGDDLSVKAESIYDSSISESKTVSVGAPKSFTLLFENTNTSDNSNHEPYFNNFIVSTTNNTLDLTGTAGFRMLSTPVAVNYSEFLQPIWTQGATGADVTNGDPNVFIWNESAEGNVQENWVGVTDLDTAATPGKGFLVYVYEDDNYTEAGGTDWPKTLSVGGTENGDNIKPAMNSQPGGFTLVGNPYASTINFGDLSKTGLTDVAYVWDPNFNDGEYGDANQSNGSWITTNGTVGDLKDGLIAPFQGFFVQNAEDVSGGVSLTFNTSNKAGGSGQFYGKQIADDPVYARFRIQGNGLSTSAWLQFSEAGSEAERVRGDALKLESLSGQFAQLAFSKQISPLLDIAHMPIQDGNYELPVHFTATASGSYSISASQFQIPAGLKLTFHDYENDVAIPVDEHFTYSFNFELPQAAKAADVPLPGRLVQTPLVAKSNGETTRFGITVSAGLGVKNEAPHGKPAAFALAQNYPNPFNPSTVIGYQLPQSSHVRLEVYDLLGQKVATLVDGVVTAGAHQVTFDGASLSSGVYIYRLSAGSQVFTKKLTLIK